MPVRKQLRDILELIAASTKNNVNADTYDIVIYERLNHVSKEEINLQLNELCSYGFIGQRGRKPGMSVRLFHLTREGLDELGNQELR